MISAHIRFPPAIDKHSTQNRSRNLANTMILVTQIANPNSFSHKPFNLHVLNNPISSYLSPFRSKDGSKQYPHPVPLKAQKNNRLGIGNWVLQKPTNVGPSPPVIIPYVWEEPAVYDSEEEGSIQGLSPLEFIRENGSKTGMAEDNEQLIKEVEQLLEPEERAILQKNEAPDFSKLTSPKWIPFHTLATSGQILLMDDVLKHGFDVNAVNKDGLTAIHKAVLCKREAVVSRLLKRGADPHVRDKDGATLLHYAVLVAAIQTLKLLIKHSVDVNLADNEGWTPLHLAVQSRTRDVAKILLVNGADKTIKNKDGNTPFDVAISFGKGFKTYEITKLLKLVPATGV